MHMPKVFCCTTVHCFGQSINHGYLKLTVRFRELIEVTLSVTWLSIAKQTWFQPSCCREDNFCHHHCHSYSSHCFCFLSNNYSYLHLQWSFETKSPERIRRLYVPSVLVKWHFQTFVKIHMLVFL